MKKFFTLSLIFAALSISVTKLYAQTCYATLASGSWAATTTWETYSSFAAAIAAAPGSGTAATTIPSGTHNVLIRSGHTVSTADANRGCKGMIIQQGGALDGSANTALRRLQIGSGGTGFTYPLVDTIQVEGTMGGVGGQFIRIESGVNARTINFSGSGKIDIAVMRFTGGAGAAAGGLLDVNINTNINLYAAAGHALTLIYTPALTDNYTMNIAAGKTVAIKSADGQFNYNSSYTTYGKYTYNIYGTLDLSANTASSSNISGRLYCPLPATSKVTLNVDGGLMKLGNEFRADTLSTSTGVLEMNVKNGGVVDATATTKLTVKKTTDGAGGVRDLFFGLDATGTVKQTVGATAVNYPIGLMGGTTHSNLSITNAGTSDIYTVGLKSSLVNSTTRPQVNRQWDISEAVVGGSNVTLGFNWFTADQGAGFTPSGIVNGLHWNGATYDTMLAVVTGTGVYNDPYIATAPGYTAFSPTGVANGTGGAAPILFNSINVNSTNSNIKLTYAMETELNINNYLIQRSADGINFSTVATIKAININKYTWFDNNPIAGLSYYRIIAISNDGSKLNSQIVKVNTNTKLQAVNVYPNPVKNGLVNVQTSNITKGIYTVKISNNLGQNVFTKFVSIEGGSSVIPVALPLSVKAGMYNLQLVNGASKFTKALVVE